MISIHVESYIYIYVLFSGTRIRIEYMYFVFVLYICIYDIYICRKLHICSLRTIL